VAEAPFFVWQGSYQAAILETNDNKLPDLLQAAKAAIDNRIHDLQRTMAVRPKNGKLSPTRLVSV